MSNRMQRACVIGAATLALIAVCLAGIYVRYGGSWPIDIVSSSDQTPDKTMEEVQSTPGETGITEETAPETEVYSEEVTSDTENDTTEQTSTEPEEPTVTESETEIPTEKSGQEKDPLTGIQKAFIGRLAIDMEKTDLVYVREEPNTNSRILTALGPSDVVRYKIRVDNFYNVMLDGFEGYVHMDYVLTDLDCYEARKDYIGYAVMCPRTDVMLYAEMDDSQSPMIAAEKADEFKLVGIEDGWYKVAVNTPRYDYLYLKQDEVFVYPFCLNYGDVSELKDWEKEYLDSIDLSANIRRAEDTVIERESELAAYSQYDSIVASEKAEEAAREAARKKEAEEKARREAAERAARYQSEAAARREQADETGEMVLLGTDFVVTKYCHCTKCCGKWGHDDPNYQAHGASGMNLIAGVSVAVDPNFIPYGSRLMVYIPGEEPRECIAMDTTDHLVFGSHWLDLYCQTHAETSIHGEVHNVTVYLLPNN